MKDASHLQKPEIIVIPEGKICDYIDGKFRNDTPEEYVRQTIEKRLVNEHKYSKDRIKIEYAIKSGSTKPRVDIAIFPDNCETFKQEDVEIIIECKKENIEPSSRKDGVGQLKSYMSSCPNCKYGMWTNGKHKEVLQKVVIKNKIDFIDRIDIPAADGETDETERPERNRLRSAFDDNMLFVFKTCHNHIYATDGLQKQPAFFELLKIIFCKIVDEKNILEPIEFYTTSSERSNPDGQLTVKNRISKIFNNVKSKYPKIFDKSDEIKLLPRSLAYVVSELQKYSLLNTHIDIKGKAYEELVGANLRGDRGEFFTPRNITHMTVDILHPKVNERVLDPACGTGGFLVMAMNRVIEDIKQNMEKNLKKLESEWTTKDYEIVREKVQEIAANNFFGFDINPDLVKATKMNMVMNNDGSGNILRSDALLPPHEWSQDFREKLADALKINPNKIVNSKSIAFFDVVITNPPFGSKIPIKDTNVLEQYEVAYIWNKINDGKHWVKTNELQTSVPPEHLFIERCLQFLKPGRRMGIVLPDAILGAPWFYPEKLDS